MQSLKKNMSSVGVLKKLKNQATKHRSEKGFFTGANTPLKNIVRSLKVFSKSSISSMPKKATTKKVAKKTAKKIVKKVTKKASKKVSMKPKKVAKKTTKKVSKNDFKMLVCASDDECFWTTDGSVLQSLEELKLAFGTMGDEVYMHHVTKEKNDFADWVDTVLQDRDCATALRRSRKPSSAKMVVVKHLRFYT